MTGTSTTYYMSLNSLMTCYLAYSLICDSLLDTHTSRDDLKLDIPSSTNNTKRETEERLCLFGLPDIIFPEPSTFATSNYRNPWLYLVFAVVVILFVAESRLRSSRSWSSVCLSFLSTFKPRFPFMTLNYSYVLFFWLYPYDIFPTLTVTNTLDTYTLIYLDSQIAISFTHTTSLSGSSTGHFDREQSLTWSVSC